METTNAVEKLVGRDLGQLAEKANRLLRTSNIYRAAEYQLAAQYGRGASSLLQNQFAVDSLGTFEENNQEIDRPDWARKLQLSHRSKRLCFGLAAMVKHCAEHPTNNPVVLLQLKQISDAMVGPRSSTREARAYMRKAALKLHPDKCRDLEGWRIPNIAYSRYMPVNHKYEQAKWGAEGLYALHRSLDQLFSSEHYAVALYEPGIKKGPSLDPKNVLAEYSLMSAVFCFIVPKAMPAAGTAGAILAAWWLLTMAKRRLVKHNEVTCRELIPFVPKLSSGKKP